MSELICAYIMGILTVVLVAVAIVHLYADHPDLFQRAKASGIRYAAWILRDKLECQRVASEIEATINTACEAIEREAPGSMPYIVGVQWVKDITREALLEDPKIIVKMDYHTNQARNLVVATVEYISKGLLPRARIYLDTSLEQAVDIQVIKAVLEASRQPEALTYFVDEELEPSLEAHPEIRDDCAMLDELIYVGSFSRIYLRELHRFGDKLYPATSSRRIWTETRSLANHLYTIATKRPDERVKLEFEGRNARLAVMLFTRDETMDRWGLAAYERRLVSHVIRGLERIYLSGIGADNVAHARSLARKSQHAGRIKIVEEIPFETTTPGFARNEAIIIICEPVSPEEGERIGDPSDVVYLALENEVPEIQQGRIEVVAIAREPQVGSKAIVRAVEPSIDPVGCCVGRSAQRLNAVRARLGGEWLNIIPYTDNLRELVVDALFTLEQTDITNVWIDQLRGRAYVRVNSPGAVARALGKARVNVRLASRVCGLDIRVEEAP